MGAASKHLTEEKVRAALELANGNRGRAAELLGVNPVTVWRAMKKYAISPTWVKRDAA